MVKRIAISAIGKDRPGIVAAVTRALYETGCNIEDSSMSLLYGQFAMILIAALPAGLAADALEAALQKETRRMKMAVSLHPLPDKKVKAAGAKHPCIVAVYGADRPGIVYRTSKLLADSRINITDVQTNTAARGGKPVYVMFLEVELPSARSLAPLRKKLEALGRELKVTVTLNPVETSAM